MKRQEKRTYQVRCHDKVVTITGERSAAIRAAEGICLWQHRLAIVLNTEQIMVGYALPLKNGSVASKAV